jgi:hypothetical protein
MEERGVSKLVGMKLTAPQEASTTPTSNGHGESATQRNFPLEAAEPQKSFAARR